MCKYCDNFGTIVSTEDLVYEDDPCVSNLPIEVCFEQYKGKIFLNIYYDEDGASVSINYCPFCGKKLV